MTEEVRKALLHVQSFFPNVVMVVFNRQGQWQYMTEDFEPPVFSHVNIDLDILEEACNSIVNFPCVFQLETE